MANQYWIINKATLSYNYVVDANPPDDQNPQDQILTIFAQRRYVFEASKDGKWDPPLSELTGTNNHFRVVQTDGTTANLRLPNLTTGFSGTEGVNYKTMQDSGTWYVQDKLQSYNPDADRWTTYIKVAGSWDKAKAVPLNDRTRRIWE